MIDSQRLMRAALKIIDPRVERIGITKIRTLNLKRLREVSRPIIVDAPGGGEPIAVIIPFGNYLEVQKTMFEVE